MSTARFNDSGSYFSPLLVLTLGSTIRVPTDHQAYYVRGRIYTNLQRYKEALSDFTQVIQLAPNYTEAYYSRGTIQIYLQRYEEALADFNRVLQFNPNHAWAYYNRSITYAELRQDEKALTDAIRALVLDPALLTAYLAADVPEQLLIAVAQLPFMIAAEFIHAAQQALAKLPSAYRPIFEQRLMWLHRIANERPWEA